MSADDFRRSIENSLPPLTHHGNPSMAPGLYGAFGWGVVNQNGGGGGQQSVRASRQSFTYSEQQDGEPEPEVSASQTYQHRPSGSGYQYPDPSAARYDVGTSVASRKDPPQQQQQTTTVMRSMGSYSGLPYAGQFRGLPQVQAPESSATPPLPPKAPTSFSGYPQPVMGDACCVVQTASPRPDSGTNFYPVVPPETGAPDRSRNGRVPPLQTAGLARNSGGRPQHAAAPSKAVQPEVGVQFSEQVTYHRYQQQPQQPYTPHMLGQPAPSVSQPAGKVVHMRRSEAWTKYIAYEGCLQVCVNELGQGDSQNAQYFLSQAFTPLKNDFGIDDLLLTQVASLPSGSETTNDICWDDLEQPDKRLNVNTVAFANTTATSYLKIRCQRLTVPNKSMVQKLCCRAKTTFSMPSFQGMTVYLTPADPNLPSTHFALDGRGGVVDMGQGVTLTPEQQQHGGQPLELHVHVEGPEGTALAVGTIPYSQLWRLGSKSEAIDEAHERSAGPGSLVELQVSGVDAHQGKVAFVTLSVLRLRKEVVANYEVAQVAPDQALMPGGADTTVNKNSLRTNACLAYDMALGAALKADGCCRTKLLIDGPWQWLLVQFAMYFGVRQFYCLLAHLRWVLKPGVASISTMCLDVIGEEVKPLLAQMYSRGLTTHESTLLETVKKAVEQLLEVAFENYYALGDDTPRPLAGGETPRGASGETAWRPTVLMAAFRLFRTMKDVFLPTDQDWLNTRFRIAAKKRWHFLESNCGYEQMQQFGGGSQSGGIQRGNQPAPRLGVNTNANDSTYKMAERMSMAIRSDLEFDIFLQRQPDLLPSTLNLPRITAEEYMANYVEILRNMLAQCPPLVPSTPAVDLLVATAQLQRYLHETQLYMAKQHPGHLDAMDLWRPHVLFWIDNSRKGLCGHCTKLEAEAKLTAAHLARVDVNKIAPGMIDSIEGAVAPLVRDMLDRTWAELMLYERVVRNWPLFGPHLEAALCDVLRTIQGSLNRICANASNTTSMSPAQGPQGYGAPASPLHANMHRRVLSSMPGTSSPGPMAMAMQQQQRPGYGPQRGGPGMAQPGGSPLYGGSPGPGPGGMPGRNVVLLKEAVLLNSLKVLMVMVPSIEDIISKWCGGPSVVPPGPPQPNQPDPEFEDDLAPHIGAQFAQVVKEQRTDYGDGVHACANRMADFIRASPLTNIKAALQLPKPPSDPYQAQVSTLTAQKEFVESFMRPILAACDDAIQAMRGAFDPRVFVATGRALWDCIGKDLFEFVHYLQEGHDNKGAWRVRQHANLALASLCEYFRDRLATSMQHCISERDLDLPNHVDKAQKLLAQNSAAVNITLNPI